MTKKEYIVELKEEEADELMSEHWVSELVRCKECKHYNEETGVCDLYHAHGYAETWYCADGEVVKQDADN